LLVVPLELDRVPPGRVLHAVLLGTGDDAQEESGLQWQATPA
jgi:hypothetical protein